MSGVALYVPIDKARIDKANRMVYGTAQMEEGVPDLQGDIVAWDATKKAFNEWFNGIRKGNVREMHRKDMAVGQAVVMRPIEKERQMLVGVHVSKGAESTWQKVLDGTLRGFSIGGYATRTKKYFDSTLGRQVNKVLDYVLTELSLVDVPAHPKCKIIGIQKYLVAPGLTGDVSRKAKHMEIENAALAAIADMAKGVDPDEEVLIIKRSDMVVEGEGDARRIILNNDADVSEFLKGADLHEVEDALESAIAKGASASDLAEEIQVMAKGFAALCKAAGLDPADLVKDEPQAGEVAKGLNRTEVAQIVTSAVGDVDTRLGTLLDAVEDLKKRFDGAGVQPRKGVGGDGTGTAQTRAITKLDGGSETGTEEIEKKLDDLYQKRDELIAKMEAGQKLSPTDEVLKKSVGEEIDKLEAARATPSARIVRG